MGSVRYIGNAGPGSSSSGSSSSSSRTRTVLAVTRPRPGGGTITVTRGGKVTETDASGRTVSVKKVGGSSGRSYVESESKKIQQEVALKQAQKDAGSTLSVSRSLEGGGSIIVTRAGLVTKYDQQGRLVEQFKTDPVAALKFVSGESKKIQDVVKYNAGIERERLRLTAELRKQEALIKEQEKKPGVIYGELRAAEPRDLKSLSGIRRELGIIRDKTLQDIEKSRFRDQSGFGVVERVFKGTVVLGGLGLARGVIGVAQTIAHPIETVKGVGYAVAHPMQTLELIGKEFAVDPVGTAAEFYAYTKTVQLLGKGLKKGAKKIGLTDLAAKVKETLFIKSQPAAAQAAIKKLLAQATKKKIKSIKKVDFVRVKGLTKTEGRALLKALEKTDSLRIKIKAKGLSKTPTPVGVDIATTSFNKLASNMIKELPKAIRKQYTVKANVLLRRGVVVMDLRPISSVIRKVSLTKATWLKKSTAPKSKTLLVKSLEKVKPIVKKGKKVYPFKDIQTGKLRYFSTKKLYLKAVKAQAKFLETVKGKRLLKKINKISTKPARLALEKERVLLRKQLKLEQKLASGQQIKAPRGNYVKLNGKTVYPFEDIRTGNIRYFASRKTWLKAVKSQVKFMQTKEGAKLALKLDRLKTRPARVALQKERMALRQQQKIEVKLSKGLSVKSEKGGFVIKNGKKLYPFRDIKTKQIRYFTKRADWLKAIKRQTKTIRGRTTSLDEFFRMDASTKKVLRPKVIKLKGGIKLVDDKGKTLIEVKKAPKPKTGGTKVGAGGTVEVASGKQVLLKKLKPKVSAKVKTVQKQVIDLDKLLKKARVKGVTQRQALQFKKKLKTTQRQVLVLKKTVNVNLKLLTGLKAAKALKEFAKKLVTIAATLDKMPDKLPILTSKQAQELKTKQLIRQKLKLSPLQKLGLKPLQRQAGRSATSTKITTKTKVDIASKIKILPKTKLITPLKPKILKQKKEEQEEKKLDKVIRQKIKQRKFIYIPDLYSAVYGVKANLAEKRNFLKRGRVFTGIELRKLV